MKKQKAKTATPKLRFSEFRGGSPWEWETLGDVCEMQAGTFVSAAEIAEKPSRGAYPCYGGNGLRGYTVTSTHSGKYPIIGRQGAHCGNVRFVDGEFYATEHALVATPRSDVDVTWLYYTLGGLRLNRFATGQAQPGLSVDVLIGVGCAVPAIEAEQQKIADCLASLDEVIAAQGHKVEALKAHKRGLMQQLFPREGETRPRLRFPEFRDAPEWVRRSLSDIARLRNGYAFKSSEYVETGPYQIVTIANVQQSGLLLESTKKIAELPSDLQQHQILRLGDILISMTGNVGRVCRVTAESLLLNQRVGKLTPDAVYPEFFYQLLQRDEFRSAMQLKAAGGAQGNLSAGDISGYVFCLPAEPQEQQRIADCLSSLDTQITAETHQLAALKSHKQGLMQQLFPAPEAAGA
ncbi:MAG: restriction endonuclease subunit S [Lysobacteraceae bacterium]